MKIPYEELEKIIPKNISAVACVMQNKAYPSRLFAAVFPIDEFIKMAQTAISINTTKGHAKEIGFGIALLPEKATTIDEVIFAKIGAKKWKKN